MLTTLAIGLFLGMEHALDADHVVAVSTMVSQRGGLKRASLVGLFWGLGHTATLFLAGLVVILFKLSIPPRLALSMEFAVGVILVALGVSVVRGYIAGRVHAHAHRHGGEDHRHFHSHAATRDHAHGHAHPAHARSLLVGMVHGLAGSAALMLLVLSTISTPALGLLYIVIFGAGSVVGMLGMSTLVGVPFSLAAQRSASVQRTLRMACGSASIAYGAWILVRAGVVDGLFR
jgi:ABC-type nickel/cobalt efflux system permease component RcnA